MLNLLKSLGQRIKMLFVVDAVLDLEAELATRQARRRADLLDQAADYQARGQEEVAGFLRQEAQQLCPEQPLTRLLPLLEELQEEPVQPPEKPLPDSQPPLLGTSNPKPRRRTRK